MDITVDAATLAALGSGLMLLVNLFTEAVKAGFAHFKQRQEQEREDALTKERDRKQDDIMKQYIDVLSKNTAAFEHLNSTMNNYDRLINETTAEVVNNLDMLDTLVKEETKEIRRMIDRHQDNSTSRFDQMVNLLLDERKTTNQLMTNFNNSFTTLITTLKPFMHFQDKK